MSKNIRKRPVFFLKAGRMVLVLIISCLLFTITSCKICPLSQVFRNTRDSIESTAIEGSGDYKTEERQIGEIDEVVLSTVGELNIKQSDKYSLTVEAEDNILPLIRTEVSGGRLTISIKPGFNIRNLGQIQYYLTIKDLDYITAISSGDVFCQKLNTEEIEINLSSSGGIEIDYLQSDELEVNISSSGDAVISGKVREQKIRLSSSGNYIAEGLESSECRINISSSGDAFINVSERLIADLTSSGDLYFTGDPETEFNTSSSGRIHSID